MTHEHLYTIATALGIIISIVTASFITSVYADISKTKGHQQIMVAMILAWSTVAVSVGVFVASVYFKVFKWPGLVMMTIIAISLLIQGGFIVAGRSKLKGSAQWASNKKVNARLHTSYILAFAGGGIMAVISVLGIWFWKKDVPPTGLAAAPAPPIQPPPMSPGVITPDKQTQILHAQKNIADTNVILAEANLEDLKQRQQRAHLNALLIAKTTRQKKDAVEDANTCATNCGLQPRSKRSSCVKDCVSTRDLTLLDADNYQNITSERITSLVGKA